MKIVFMFLMIFSSLCFSDEVKISLNPSEPVVGESFNVIFKINTENGTDPIVNFNPGSGLEVVGREEAGVTTSTTYINGHLSVERNITIIYEMVATSSGYKYLNDISIDLSGKSLRHKNFRFNVSRTARKAKDIMAVVQVDKESAYVGESILVRYYLYNKVTVNTTDIKKFPKLDKFMKRYHQEKMVAERVQYNGEIYTRRVLYTAQLFADQPGKYKIDPITLSAQYYKGTNNPYSNLGLNFGLRSQMSTSVTSETIEIDIKALPTENMPKHFTGLVGVHTFTLSQNKNKFLVNDPIEFKVTVKGEGALELFDMPKLLKRAEIEEFDTTTDLSIGSDFSATKIFNSTYLGRSFVNIEEQQVPLSYFDPQKNEYITTYLTIKPIMIAGGNASAVVKVDEQVKSDNSSVSQKVEDTKIDLEPFYTFSNSFIYSSKYINYILILIIFVLITFYSFKYIKENSNQSIDLVKEIKKDGLNYGRLHRLISLVDHGLETKEIIANSNMKDETKKYLLHLVDKCEKDYSKGMNIKKYKIKSKYLNEISNIIKEKNETS